MVGSIPLLVWLWLAVVAVGGAGGFFFWRWRRAVSGLFGVLSQPQERDRDTAACGFLCLARYRSSVALPGDALYPVHGILHFRRLPRDFRLLPSATLKAHLQPVRWVCCLQSVDLYRIVMRLHFERHIAGHLFQITEQEFCASVRLATTMVPGARILNQSAQTAKATTS